MHYLYTSASVVEHPELVSLKGLAVPPLAAGPVDARRKGDPKRVVAIFRPRPETETSSCLGPIPGSQASTLRSVRDSKVALSRLIYTLFQPLCSVKLA